MRSPVAGGSSFSSTSRRRGLGAFAAVLDQAQIDYEIVERLRGPLPDPGALHGAIALDGSVAPGVQGPALNRDGALLDGFYVLEGTLSLQLGDEQLEAPRGAFALAPAGKATFANRSAQDVRVLKLSAPAWPLDHADTMAGMARSAFSGGIRL